MTKEDAIIYMVKNPDKHVKECNSGRVFSYSRKSQDFVEHIKNDTYSNRFSALGNNSIYKTQR